MLDKPIDQLEFTDIMGLIENEVGESKRLEYKRELNIETGDERKEFLADISSFANADGGYIIYGIAENEFHLPIEICGVKIDNEGNFISKIDNLIRDSIAPRIPDIKYRFILHNGHKVLVIYISPSFLSPHRVIYKGHDKFYTRNAKGKYPMDVDELRQAFTFSDSINRQIESYKLERISTIAANRYRILKDGYPYFIIQFLPISAFRNRNLYSIREISNALEKVGVEVFGCFSSKQIIIDGVFIRSEEAIAHYKTNGIVEKATTAFFDPEHPISSNKTIKRIYCGDILEKVIGACVKIFKYYKIMNIPTPIIIACAIMNGQGYTIYSMTRWIERLGSIDRDALLIPDILVDDFNSEPETILKPIFDAIWNACGYTHCPAYDEDGNYIGIKRL